MHVTELTNLCESVCTRSFTSPPRLSRSLADRWGTTGEFTISFLHSSPFSAFRSMMCRSRPVPLSDIVFRSFSFNSVQTDYCSDDLVTAGRFGLVVCIFSCSFSDTCLFKKKNLSFLAKITDSAHKIFLVFVLFWMEIMISIFADSCLKVCQ